MPSCPFSRVCGMTTSYHVIHSRPAKRVTRWQQLQNARSASRPSMPKFIDSQVASGAYASASEVVRAGLRALQERDAAVELWLREQVAPVYDAMKNDPSRAIPAAKAFRCIRARHAKRVKASRRAKT